MPSTRLFAALLAFLAVSLPAEALEESFEIIGWSADEQRFAVRQFALDTTDMGGNETYCPGYVDHKGEQFRGALKLGVFEKGKKPTWFPIQDNGKCTPPKKSRERLEKAKQQLATLGIDLKEKKPGTELLPENGLVTVKEGPGAPYTIESEEQVKDTLKGKANAKKGKAPAKEEEESEEEEEELDAPHQVKGELVVFLRQGSERRQLFSEKVDGTYTPMHAGHYTVKLAKVWLSPSGKTVVIISQTSSGDMRYQDVSLRVLGVQRWDGTPLVLR
jgi:hypothetical protein